MTECLICLNEFPDNEIIKPCSNSVNHIYCITCFNDWLNTRYPENRNENEINKIIIVNKERSTKTIPCPMCRQDCVYTSKCKNGNDNIERNGTLIEVKSYVNGNIEGEVKKYTEEGKLIYECFVAPFSIKDQLYYERNYLQFKKSKKYVDIDDIYMRCYRKMKFNEKVIKSPYIILDGLYKEYFCNGNIRIQKMMDRNIHHGFYEKYYSNGALEIKCNYYQNILHGHYQSFYENSFPYVDCHYDNGELIGDYIEYNKDNEILKKVFYSENNKKHGVNIAILNNMLEYEVYNNGKLLKFYKFRIYNTLLINHIECIEDNLYKEFQYNNSTKIFFYYLLINNKKVLHGAYFHYEDKYIKLEKYYENGIIKEYNQYNNNNINGEIKNYIIKKYNILKVNNKYIKKCYEYSVDETNGKIYKKYFYTTLLNDKFNDISIITFFKYFPNGNVKKVIKKINNIYINKIYYDNNSLKELYFTKSTTKYNNNVYFDDCIKDFHFNDCIKNSNNSFFTMILDGKYIEYYPSNKIKKESYYLNNSLNGIVNKYYENGNLKSQLRVFPYKSIYYDINGTIINSEIFIDINYPKIPLYSGMPYNFDENINELHICNIVNNEFDGTYMKYKSYGGVLKLVEKNQYVKGFLDGKSLKFVNNKLYEKAYYKKNKLHNIFKRFDLTTGKITDKISYKNDVRNGISKSYYQDGKIHEKEYYINDKLNGVVYKYNNEGKLYSICNYENDKLHGIQTFYENNGVRNEEFIHGKRNGNWSFVSNNLNETKFFENDIPVKVHEIKRGNIISESYNYDITSYDISKYIDEKLIDTNKYIYSLYKYSYTDSNKLSINGIRLLEKDSYYTETTYKNAFYKSIYCGKVYIINNETNSCIMEFNLDMNSKINGEFISYYTNGNKYIRCNYENNEIVDFYEYYDMDNNLIFSISDKEDLKTISKSMDINPFNRINMNNIILDDGDYTSILQFFKNNFYMNKFESELNDYDNNFNFNNIIQENNNYSNNDENNSYYSDEDYSDYSYSD